MRVRVEVPVPPTARATMVGLMEAVTPEGETDAVRATVPEKPFRLASAMVEIVETPWMTVTLDGTETEKLGGFGGLNGLSRTNLTIAGDEVPDTYKRSRVGLVPVALMFNP